MPIKRLTEGSAATPPPPDNPSLNFVTRSGDLVSSPMVGLVGVTSLMCVLSLSRLWRETPAGFQMFLLLFCTAAPMVLIDLLFNHVHLRPDTGLTSAARAPVIYRCLRKYAGFLISLGILFVAYWLLPEYRKAEYRHVREVCQYIVPFVLLAAIPYIIWVDCRQKNPHDIYDKLGGLVLGKWSDIHTEELKIHALVWLVKGFFLPLMLLYMSNNLSKLSSASLLDTSSFPALYTTTLNLYFIVDVTLGSVGYLLTLRALDSHVRMPETTTWGWAVTLACYPPFSPAIAMSYYSFKGTYTWMDWLAPYPVLFITWGFAILLLFGVYTWATVCFGYRFSNLTNRGIVVNGPYRYTKHPAYICKCAGWWLLTIPFLAFGTTELCVQAMLLLTIKCAFYYARAKAEERMLEEDPAYRSYADWIAQHGIFSSCSFPLLARGK